MASQAQIDAAINDPKVIALLQKKETDRALADAEKMPGVQKILSKSNQSSQLKSAMQGAEDALKNIYPLVSKGGSSLGPAALEGLHENFLGLQRALYSLIGSSDKANETAKKLSEMQDDFYSDPKNGVAQHAARLGGKYGVYLAGGPEIDAIEGLSGLPYVAASGAKYAGTGAGMGILTADPNEDLSTAGEVGAALNVAGVPIGKLTDLAITKAIIPGTKAAWNYLVPGEYVKQLAKQTKVPSHEIEKRANVSNTPSLIGSALELKNVKNYELDTLPSMPFMEKPGQKLADIADELNTDASNILENLTEHNNSDLTAKSDVGKKLQQNVQAQFNFIKNVKKYKYDERDTIGDELNFKLDPKEFKKTLQQAINQYGATNRDFGSTTFKTDIDEMQRMLDTIDRRQKESGDAYLPLSTASFQRADINSKIEEAKSPTKEGMWGLAKSGLLKDIEDQISGSGLGELKDAHEDAENYYKTKYLPLKKDPKIMSIVNDRGDTDLIQQTFLPKSSDRPTILSEFINASVRPEEAKKLLLTDYLRSAVTENMLGEKVADPKKLFSLINKLGDDRLSMLIDSPSDREQIQTFMNRFRLNHEALDRLYSPKTGYAGLAQHGLEEAAKFAGDTAENVRSGDAGKLMDKAAGLLGAANASDVLANPDTLKEVARIKKKYEDLMAEQGASKPIKNPTAPLRRALVLYGSGAA